ncbi:hypothetical protein TcasGA2_TC032779 [Tribolium castaneum]|uniref:Uncharacterized protein n=1 Tax=Tribolium castaneum TaxID=7070 RepID=A0A139WJ74_TRICA|nr:PREDICTED: uncharacterized protein LOC100142190 [Tribolium castaneum]KYB27891.1 hypothetical protein TcasGA2_TC032779 [Tribolium castaneum]|eukprot:XP_001815425.1 PREDICTED: uncharacterized protein LOC100142190 [Tribolium castaneum]
MTVQATNAKNAAESKFSQKCVQVRSFYNKHFPTDRRTFNLRLPFVGLILSVLALHFVTSEFAVRWYFGREINDLARYCYIFAAAGVGFELYYGLKIGDRKQYTPWILLKFVELGFICATIIYIFVDSRNHLNSASAAIIYGFILLVLNGFVTYIVTSASWRQFHGKPTKTDVDENIYETYDDV